MMKKTFSGVGDVVLVYSEGQPVVYARIESIEPDVKKDWFQVSLSILTIPLQAVTWILRKEYVDGEGFTMGGKNMKLERLESAVLGRKSGHGGPASRPKGSEKPSKVIEFKKH